MTNDPIFYQPYAILSAKNSAQALTTHEDNTWQVILPNAMTA